MSRHFTNILGIFFGIMSALAAYSHVEAARPWPDVFWWSIFARSGHAAIVFMGMTFLWGVWNDD